MSEPADPSTRPHQVGMGAWLAIAAGVLHVVGSFDDMRGLRSLETGERVDEALKALGDSGLALSRDQLLDAMHVGVLVSAAAAVAAIVMGIQALRRDRIAPWVLIAASLLVIGGSLMFDPLMGMLMAAGTVLLWSGPARDWFAGRPIRSSRLELAMNAANDKPHDDPAQQPTQPPVQPPVQQPAQQPAQPPVQQPGQPPAYAPVGHPYGTAPVPAHGQPTPPQRPPVPSEVKAAALITIGLSALTALVCALTMLVLLVLPRAEIREALDEAIAGDPRLRDGLPEGVSIDDLTAMVGVLLGVFVIWAAVSTILAILVWRGHNWARVLLVASSAVTGLVSLLAVPATVLHIMGALAVVVLLLLPGTNAWFRSRGAFVAPAVPPTHQQSQPPAQQPPPDRYRDDDGQPPVW